MNNNEANSWIGAFVVKNIKTILTCVVFVCSIYFEHQASMVKIGQLERDIAQVRSQVDAQYAKLDNIKLDKAVFEVTMRQFSDMSADLRQIRDIMENKHIHSDRK